jgi:hypothetical protein
MLVFCAAVLCAIVPFLYLAVCYCYMCCCTPLSYTRLRADDLCAAMCCCSVCFQSTVCCCFCTVCYCILYTRPALSYVLITRLCGLCLSWHQLYATVLSEPASGPSSLQALGGFGQVLSADNCCLSTAWSAVNSVEDWAAPCMHAWWGLLSAPAAAVSAVYVRRQALFPGPVEPQVCFLL